MKVLLIEDEIGLADALKEVLTREKYMVDISHNGIDGLNHALTGIYDAIILDIMLPGMNGFEVLKELRSAKISTPILMLTAKSELEDKIQGLDGGADDYLTKPFQTGELLARIRAITRRQGEITDGRIEYGDLELKLKKSELVCKSTGQSVRLGIKELQLLETLMRNQNQIVTKEQLVEKIWGFDNESEYNNVEVYISFVRKKISFVGSNVKIKAARGLGYSLEEEK
ncbi:MAG: response regulator transcription factor [Clostridiaceae bacterium]|nr:response regulator transcription factor [Clostridiaceae bacterium]